jgi:diacylglycerol kinase family enzyme
VDVRVVVNCGAGSVDDDEKAAQRDEITAAFRTAGAECSIDFVSGDGLEAAVRNSAEAAPDVVVVAGGDGSLGTAAAALCDGSIPLGVLPFGTFNHFAKDLGLPADVGEAAAVIVSGRSVPVDVADVNGRCFVNNSSIGVYPEMVRIRDRIRDQRGWGKVRAVPVAAWRALHRFPVRRFSIDVDDHREQLRTPFVFVGNGRYETGSGGIGGRSRLDGGEVCLYVAKATSRRKLIGVALRSLFRPAHAVPDLEEHCAREITVDAHGHRVHVALDGEVATLRSPLHYRSRPGALLVRISAG